MKLGARVATVHVDDSVVRDTRVVDITTLAARQLEVDPSFFALQRHGAVVPPNDLIQEAIPDDEVATASLALGPPPEVPPLEICAEVVGTERVMVARLPIAPRGTNTAPIYLTALQHQRLGHFVETPCSHVPALAMLTGTIKSGKSTVLNRVLPGMVAARHAAQPFQHAPVFFFFSFDEGRSAQRAVAVAAHELNVLAQRLGIKLPAAAVATEAAPSVDVVDTFPQHLRAIAKEIAGLDGQLWVFFDEIQSPVVTSSSKEARRFTRMLTNVVRECSSFAKIAVTGSGMLSFLEGARNHSIHGFPLWSVTQHIQLGTAYNTATATAMAEALKAAYAPSLPILPAQLARDVGQDGRAPGLTSARPALIAHLLQACSGRLGAFDGEHGPGTYESGWRTVTNKLWDEAKRDAALALSSVCEADLQVLAALAEPSVERLKSKGLLSVKPTGSTLPDLGGFEMLVTAILSDDPADAGTERALQPPYSLLLRSWLSPCGAFVVRLHEGTAILSNRIVQNLASLSNCREDMPDALRIAVSKAVLNSLAEHGVGVPVLGADPKQKRFRPPCSLHEIQGVDAFQTVLRLLHWHDEKEPEEKAFLQAVDAKDDQYLAEFGLTMLCRIAHWRFRPIDGLSVEISLMTSGLTLRTLTKAVRAAVEEISRDRMCSIDDTGFIRLGYFLGALPTQFGRD